MQRVLDGAEIPSVIRDVGIAEALGKMLSKLAGGSDGTLQIKKPEQESGPALTAGPLSTHYHVV